MRKAYRSPGSKSTCALCHPAKAGWERRWKFKDEERLRRFEHVKREIKKMNRSYQQSADDWDDF